ncbi:MAG TPA: glutamyl-tRNA reductase [Acidimicrobiales bacterium]|nr:glutamyl-tRNA reductase [Acidimicrobiales bacterium]
MAVVVVGMHERDVPLEVFELVAVSEQELRKALAELVASPNVSEAVILSTCLRTEVYAAVDRFHDGVADIETFFRARMGMGEESRAEGARGAGATAGEHFEAGERRPEPGGGVLQLRGGLSCRYDDAAIAYLFEVTAGIDSPVLGEGEILRQVKDAAEAAAQERASAAVLGPLFRHAVAAGKRARTETAIQRGTTSLANAAVELAADRAHGFDGKRLLLIGAGEMGAGMARALAGRADLTGDVVVANRGAERAAEAADMLAAAVVGLGEVASELEVADVVLTSTGADDVVMGAAMFEAALAGRRARLRAAGGPTAGVPPVVVVDLAIPRDVDPAVSTLAGVTLLDVEDVRRYAEEEMAGREGEIPAVRFILAEELDRYRSTAAGRLAAPVVAALRERAESLCSAELARHRARLDQLDAEDRELIETVTRRVVAKLLHDPTVRLKEAAGSPRGERLAEALRALFDL